jgi:hypothetical protein
VGAAPTAPLIANLVVASTSTQITARYPDFTGMKYTSGHISAGAKSALPLLNTTLTAKMPNYIFEEVIHGNRFV